MDVVRNFEIMFCVPVSFKKFVEDTFTKEDLELAKNWFNTGSAEHDALIVQHLKKYIDVGDLPNDWENNMPRFDYGFNANHQFYARLERERNKP